MLKKNETTDPNSCLSKAGDDEMLFVLRAKDAAAPEVIYKWIDVRIRLGLNRYTDPKIQEAVACARIMEEQRASMTEQTLPGAQPPAFDGATGRTTETLDLTTKGQEGRFAKGEGGS